MLDSKNQFDAIVVGSGISGGWAAKELTEKGLKVLMLDRGRMVEHGKDYITEHMPPWKIPFRGKPLRDLYEQDYEVQSNLKPFNETSRHFFNNDRENPYVYDEEVFKWFRADVVGGRSLLWGRQTYRLSEQDFEANKRDGHGIDWPIRYDDIAPWYSYVEKHVGISGQAENLPQLPDGEFLPPMEMNVMEKTFKKTLESKYSDRSVIMGRCAVLTQPHKGRGACHYCGPCNRGCAVGAYFSTQSSTLPAARKTGNLTLKSDCVVESLDYDPIKKRISGVKVIDANTREKSTYTASVVFLCASTVASTQILLNSRSEAFPNGLANSSGTLGHYLMDHTLHVGAYGTMPGHEDKTTFGNRPNGIYIPRFRNLSETDKEVDFIRGYGYQGFALRPGWRDTSAQTPGFGKAFKESLRKPGPWVMHLRGFGECLPYHSNRVKLSRTQKDRFGIPQVEFEFSFRENENRMRQDIVDQAEEMLSKSGATNIVRVNKNSVGGEGIHEMGTARMGRDPATSVLNRWNQAHDVPNLFVTDGSCMTSSSCVNPSLTYMALTARAADYAAKLFKAGEFSKG